MQLHTLEFESNQISQISVGSSPNVEEQGNLDGHGSATTVSGPTPTLDFAIACSGPDGRVRAVEAAQLLSVPAFSPLAVAIPSQPDLSGYYAPSSVDREVTLSQPESDDHHTLPLTLTWVGSQGSHWRALETNSSEESHDEQWGNDTTELVGVPASASKVQWYDDETGAVELASATSTRQAELGAVDLYDLADGRSALSLASEQNPWLIYEVDYGAEENVDVRVWDTRGHDSKHDSDSALQWLKLFNTQHDFADPVIFDTGALRLELDEPGGTITAKTWDSSTTSWSAVGLTNSSSWSLFDVDLVNIGMVHAEAQLTFSDGSSLYALDAIATRGADTALFAIPDGEDPPIPSGIVDWLDPIAASTVFDTGESKGLVGHEEVRR